jgi:hypothetical protein
MRKLLFVAVLLGGCATRQEYNTRLYHANQCEAQYPGRCLPYWQEVWKVEDRLDNRARARRAGYAFGAQQSQPVPVYAPAPARTCVTQNMGGSLHTVCN